MTKEQAMLKIKHAREARGSFEESQQEISRIIDQIDQPQAEFTVRELVELLGKIDRRLHVTCIDCIGYWRLSTDPGSFQSHGLGIDELKAKLLELATPQPPSEKVAVMIDRKLAGLIASGGSSLAEACREAVKAPST